MVEEKAWYYSKTIWGALMAIIASLSALTGISLDGTTQSELSELIVQLTGAIGGLIAIYGRLDATEVIA